MEDFLKNVSALHYKQFRQTAMKRCGWTAQQYANRFTGNTKLTQSEREVLQSIVDQLRNS